MELRDKVARLTPTLVSWRRHLHARPELAYEEHATAAFVAEKLASFGLTVREGLGKTGVIGVLGNGGPMTGLRADMDALPIREDTGLSYASINPGRMHACGHDGHMTMLLGAAQLLAEKPPGGRSIAFIFQPAEEGEAGGKAMIDDGLFREFPVSSVYGLHNWPGVSTGQFAIRSGTVMAAFDVFEVVVQGEGSHGAMPHEGIDPIAVAAQLYQAWQLIVSRRIAPTDAAVISVTQIHAGDSWNVIPDAVILRGTVRTLRGETRDLVERLLTERTEAICGAHGARARIRYERRYPTTVNTIKEAAVTQHVAAQVAPDRAVLTDLPPSMASEDFAYMLNEKPGAYAWLGNGSAEDGRHLHSGRYDFNDAILPIGVEYWVRLAGMA